MVLFTKKDILKIETLKRNIGIASRTPEKAVHFRVGAYCKYFDPLAT
jgi:hypothetical protein